MTSTEKDNIVVRLDFDTHAASFSRAMTQLDRVAIAELDSVQFDPRLRELVRLRVSQLNGCAYCVDLHSQDARRAGEDERRIAALPVWRESPLFTRRERAALTFAEAVTLLALDGVPDDVYDDLAEHFAEAEIAALVGLVVAVNAWNAIGVSTRAWVGGS
jgi:AhpD family alkylhydroperoxidase